MERIIRPKELVKMLGISETSIYRYEKAGSFPSRRKLSANTVGYLSSEVDAWMKSKNLPVTSVLTSQLKEVVKQSNLKGYEAMLNCPHCGKASAIKA